MIKLASGEHGVKSLKFLKPIRYFLQFLDWFTVRCIRRHLWQKKLQGSSRRTTGQHGEIVQLSKRWDHNWWWKQRPTPIMSNTWKYEEDKRHRWEEEKICRLTISGPTPSSHTWKPPQSWSRTSSCGCCGLGRFGRSKLIWHLGLVASWWRQ